MLEYITPKRDFEMDGAYAVWMTFYYELKSIHNRTVPALKARDTCLKALLTRSLRNCGDEAFIAELCAFRCTQR